MTQKSYLWDGTVTGDASIAPYDKDEFNTFMFLLGHTDNTLNRLFVIPGYLDELRVVSSDSTMSVNVLAGASLAGGRYMFTSDESVALTLDQPAATGYFRYDYIVVRVDTTTQKVRLAVIKGAETNSSDYLVAPTLTQTSFIRELPLAKIYVTDAGVVYDKYIYDMREFANNAYTANAFKLYNDNLLINSEFMVINTDLPPEGWGGIAQTAATKLTKMSRGASAVLDSTILVDTSMFQVIPLYPHNRTYTVKGIVKDVTGGSTPYFYVGLFPSTLNGTILPGTYKKQEYTNQVAGTEIEFQFTVVMDENSAYEAIQLKVWSHLGVVHVGQIIVVPGNFPGPFREFSETVMYRSARTNAGWSDTAKSTGTTLLDLNSLFGVPLKSQAVFVRVRGRDSGSAAGTADIQIQGYAAPYNTVYGRLELNGITNDVYREATFCIPINASTYYARDETPQMRVGVTATGALTFDATIEIVGVVT